MSGFLFFICALLLFFLGYVRCETLIDTVDFILCGWILIVFLIADIRHWYVPRGFALIAISLSIFIGLCGAALDVRSRFLGIFTGYVFLWCLLIFATWTMRKFFWLGLNEFAIGAGDPLLLAVIGGFFGYLPLAGVLFFASVQALAAHLFLKLCGSKDFQPEWHSGFHQVVPFGAFMCLASLELMLFPDLPNLLKTMLFLG